MKTEILIEDTVTSAALYWSVSDPKAVLFHVNTALADRMIEHVKRYKEASVLTGLQKMLASEEANTIRVRLWSLERHDCDLSSDLFELGGTALWGWLWSSLRAQLHRKYALRQNHVAQLYENEQFWPWVRRWWTQPELISDIREGRRVVLPYHEAANVLDFLQHTPHWPVEAKPDDWPILFEPVLPDRE